MEVLLGVERGDEGGRKEDEGKKSVKRKVN